jgi:YD repeat-containing protein
MVRPVFAGSDDIPFFIYYNSYAPYAGRLSQGWRHSYSSTVVPSYLQLNYRAYVTGAETSSLYSDESSACTSGFNEIKSGVINWLGASAFYSSGVCTIRRSGIDIATLPLMYSGPSAPVGNMLIVGYQATRDSGEVFSFYLSGGAIKAPPTINLKLQKITNGFRIVDSSDNVETYDSNGRLLSIANRNGLTRTMTYDGGGRLGAVNDSFGHALTIGYDAQSRISSVVH